MRIARHRHHGLTLFDHTFELPLDHGRPEGERLQVFAREVVATAKEPQDLPWLVYFQGGPGFSSPRPMARTGWLRRATEDYRVLLLDQRGTGRSSSLDAQTILSRGAAAAQAQYLSHFRADSIVLDAEAIRRELCGDKPWTALGQSFGGFCTVHYMSRHPEGLAAALITGGLPGLESHADDVYRRTYPICSAKNERYYARYPEDVERVQRIVERLIDDPVTLPSGDPLTPRKLQLLGLHFGMSDGFEAVHYLLEGAFTAKGDFHYAFLRGFENSLHYDTNPLFAILHESCYAQGAKTGWAASRMRSEFEAFTPTPDRPVLFTGEMIYPWFFREFKELAPLEKAAELIAEKGDWPALYDVAQLKENHVPAAAAVYFNDMYVPQDLSRETASKIPGLELWITNEFEHNGLRADGERILGRLIDLAHERL